MISVDDAQARILARFSPVGSEIVSLSNALGRVLASSVDSRVCQPPADVSAMDGYAVRAGDCSVTGARLKIVGEVPAGKPFSGTIGPGEAVEIFTGAIVPEGADAILILENADRDGDRLTVREGPEPGQFIRRKGQDFDLGTPGPKPGLPLTVRDIGLLGAMNHPWIKVRRRPRVAIVATGSELAEPGEPLPFGSIAASNGHMLSALVACAGGQPSYAGIVPDTEGALASALDDARHADLIVTTGGASVGSYDLMRTFFESGRITLDFWKIAMRPGKPLIFGDVNGVPILGLPGNPVSSYVTGLLFLWPIVARLSGRPEDLGWCSARLAAPVPANGPREAFLRGRSVTSETGQARKPVFETGDNSLWVTAHERQDSALIRLLSDSDCLIRRPSNAPPAAAGDAVCVLPLRESVNSL